MTVVPNSFPTQAAGHRIAFIGEAPGKDEVIMGAPFVGQSGRLLEQLMAINNLQRSTVFLGNVCQVKPPTTPSGVQLSPYDAWKPDDPYAPLYQGIVQLVEDLDSFKPNLLVLLGNDPLQTFFGHKNVTTWRGSVRRSPYYPYKCLATYHPASVLRQYEWMQVLNLDIAKAAREGTTPDLYIPERTLVIPDHEGFRDELFEFFERTLKDKPRLSIDIEGWVHKMSCLSFATSPQWSIICPFTKTDNVPFWTPEDEELIWCYISRILADPEIEKVYQNGLYDLFVKAFGHRCVVVNLKDDTMVKHWEAYCELPKSLEFQASIYTQEPPWKSERETPDLYTFWRYCCKDSAVTYEINSFLENELDIPASRRHYEFNRALLYPILYMELRGIRYAVEKAAQRRQEINTQIDQYNARLEGLAGRPINVNSPKFKDFLYDELGLPEKLNHKTGRRTADYEALLSLYKKTNHPVLDCAIRLRSLRTRSSMLGISADGDGRIRCGYNVVGSETGRITCYTSPTGSGYNLQTIPQYDRDLFLADEDCYFFQCDLSGADGWTVAAHCAKLGDPTMLDDLRGGIKIAKVVAGMFLDSPEISRLPRPELKVRSDAVKKDNPVYFGAKCCQHGTNYGMGKVLLSQTIFLQSEGVVNISAADAERLQNLYLMRYYGVRMWHRWAEQTLLKEGKLTSASGHTRIFYGRRNDHSTFKQFLSHEPQANTTYATNLAAYRLWTDPHNRWSYWRRPGLRLQDGEDSAAFTALQRLAKDRHPDSLVIEPLHQVHDALCGQFPKEIVNWATVRIREYFNNTITIAGIPLVIPFDGAYGSSWGTLEVGKV